MQIKYEDKSSSVKQSCETCLHRDLCKIAPQIKLIKDYFDGECKNYYVTYPVKIIDFFDEETEKEILSLVNKVEEKFERIDD